MIVKVARAARAQRLLSSNKTHVISQFRLMLRKIRGSGTSAVTIYTRREQKSFSAAKTMSNKCEEHGILDRPNTNFFCIVWLPEVHAHNTHNNWIFDKDSWKTRKVSYDGSEKERGARNYAKWNEPHADIERGNTPNMQQPDRLQPTNSGSGSRDLPTRSFENHFWIFILANTFRTTTAEKM